MNNKLLITYSKHISNAIFQKIKSRGYKTSIVCTPTRVSIKNTSRYYKYYGAAIFHLASKVDYEELKEAVVQYEEQFGLVRYIDPELKGTNSDAQYLRLYEILIGKEGRRISGDEPTSAHEWKRDVPFKRKYIYSDFPGSEWIDIARWADVPVLILGKTGTGKTYLAETLHKEGPRCKNNFVPFNLQAIPEGLVESELFGVVPDYPGLKSKEGKEGLFTRANEGTILIDEIAEAGLDIQAKLLDAIKEDSDEVQIRKLGEEDKIKRSVRVIAATNLSVEQLSKKLRQDLFYRFPIKIILPSFKYHIEHYDQTADSDFLKDIILKFIQEFSPNEKDSDINRLHKEAFNFIRRQEWPGNIRQLKNVIQNTLRYKQYLNTPDKPISCEELAFVYAHETQLIINADKEPAQKRMNTVEDIKDKRANIEKELARFFIDVKRIVRTGQAAATELKCSRTTLLNRLKEAQNGKVSILKREKLKQKNKQM